MHPGSVESVSVVPSGMTDSDPEAPLEGVGKVMRVLVTSTDTVAATLGVGFGIGFRADFGSSLFQGQAKRATYQLETRHTIRG